MNRFNEELEYACAWAWRIDQARHEAAAL